MKYRLFALVLIVIVSGGRCCFASGESEPNIDFKIGQMLMVGFRGLDVNESSTIVRDIQKHHLGGVVLFDYDVASKSFDRNIESPQQLEKLATKLQSFSSKPLLIAIDQEGGNVSRLKEQAGFEPTVSAQYLGEKNDLKLTYEHALKIAEELTESGINLNLAPVVDLNKNPDNPVIGKLGRSFSADANTAVAHAMEFIRAHNEKGVLCCLKHFPGHGSSRADSHLGFVDVTDRWAEDELVPFEEIIKKGEADCVMTAHIFNANLDANIAATLSRPIVADLLRDKLNYKGVVISDCLQMKAIADNYSSEEAIEKAINAGVDILLFSNNSSQYDENIVPKAAAVIKRLLDEGRISKERIEKSYKRIMLLKGKIIY